MSAADTLRAAQRLAQAPQQIQTEMQRAVQLAGQIVEAGARRKMPDYLRNVGATGAAIGATSSVRGRKRPTALIRATGPAWLYDNDRRAHKIVARPGSALNTPEGPRASVNIPAIKGKRSFETGAKEALPAAKAVIERAFHATVRLF